MNSIDYVLLLGLIGIPLMIVIYRLQASMIILWQILAAMWMAPI